MSIPSIKGVAFASVVQSLRDLLEDGQIERSALDAKLSPAELGYLDHPIQSAVWYPVRSYRGFSEILLEVEGGGRMEYMFRRGARTAERMLEAGLYRQLRFAAEGAGLDGGAANLKGAGRLIVTISAAMFNFTRWSFHVDPERLTRFAVQVDEAVEFPEVMRYASAGFCQAVTERTFGCHVEQTNERQSRDRIVLQHEIRREE